MMLWLMYRLLDLLAWVRDIRLPLVANGRLDHIHELVNSSQVVRTSKTMARHNGKVWRIR